MRARADGAFLARRRPPRGLLGATMELPGGTWTAGDLDAVGAVGAPFVAPWRRLPGFVEHVFTHFTLRLELFGAEFGGEAPVGLVWIAPQTVAEAGFSGLMRKAAEQAALAWEELRLPHQNAF